MYSSQIISLIHLVISLWETFNKFEKTQNIKPKILKKERKWKIDFMIDMHDLKVDEKQMKYSLSLLIL